MKISRAVHFLAWATVALLFAMISRAVAQLPAFPGAEGAGMFAEGGRGGDVFVVNTLLDQSGDDGDGNPLTGSLRYGIISATGPRTIVFGVGGQINLGSELHMHNKSKITIAGQTAPGDGITIAGNRFHLENTSDIVMRYLRIRVGGAAGTNLDAVWVQDSSDVIVDHVSASWGTDETISATHSSNNVTVQWSMIAEPLGGTGGHSYGSLINGGDFTYHHNLYAESRSRNPRVQNTGGDSTRLDFVNNVLYNPFDRFGYGADDVSINFVGNYAIAGPDTKASTEHLYVAGNTATKIYQSDNLMDLNKNGDFDGQDLEWDAFRDAYTPYATRFDLPLVTTERATDVLASVLAGVGDSLVRDAMDLRVLNDVITHAGNIIPNSQTEDWVGGFPTLNGGAALPDTDLDGMPDVYENSISYLSATNPLDRNLDANSNGYTDLEDYLNFLASGAAVPEPASLATLLVGGILVSLGRRKSSAMPRARAR